MKTRLWVFIIFCAFLGQGVCDTTTGDHGTMPSTNNGQKWRLGYYQGGNYQTYPVTLLSVARALLQLGWIDKLPSIKIREGDVHTEEVWKRLASDVNSEHIEFVEDAYWSLDWKDREEGEEVEEGDVGSKRKAFRENVIQRLNEGEIDLVIAMGTWAGTDLANNKHSTNTLVFAATDPIRANIIPSAQDSGYDHIHVRVDPTRFRRQVDLFYTLIPFERLGIAYIDNPEGRSFAALEDVKAAARTNGFEIVPCFVPSGSDDAKAAADTIDCHKRLAPQVDALYVTAQSGVTLRSLPNLLAPLNKYKVPTFSQAGSQQVEHGVLISIAHGGYKNVARFHAENIAKVLNGALPGDLNQIFEDPPKIALNLEAAEIIGYDPPVDILGATDEFYQRIRIAE